jgi:hypothetical protein
MDCEICKKRIWFWQKRFLNETSHFGCYTTWLWLQCGEILSEAKSFRGKEK